MTIPADFTETIEALPADVLNELFPDISPDALTAAADAYAAELRANAVEFNAVSYTHLTLPTIYPV